MVIGANEKSEAGYGLTIVHPWGIIMGKWSKLLVQQKQDRIALVQEYAAAGYTKSGAAEELGMSRQSLNQFAQANNIKFRKWHQEEDTDVVD